MCVISAGTMAGLGIASSLTKSYTGAKKSSWEQEQAYNNAMRHNQSILDNYSWDSKQLQGQKMQADRQVSQTKQDTYLEALKAADTARVYSSAMGTGGGVASNAQMEVSRQTSNAFGRLNQQQELSDLSFANQLVSMRNQAMNQQQHLNFYRPNPVLAWAGTGLSAASAGITGHLIGTRWEQSKNKGTVPSSV